MRKPPRCPDCGALGIFCDPNGERWACPKCKPEGKCFRIAPERARAYADAYREDLGQLKSVVRRHYTPIPKRSER